MDEKKFKQLIIKYQDDTCSQEERNAVDAFLDSYSEKDLKWPFDVMNEPQHIEDEILQKIRNKRRLTLYTKKKRMVGIILKIAASLLLLITIGFSLYNFQPKTKIAVIKPGGDKALLTLADGQTIILDNANNGKLATQGNTAVTKINNQIVYDATKIKLDKNAKVMINTITTPRGGQFMIVLPDGTKAWLNAASSIKFPVSFIGNERKVEISGEVYFEVSKVLTAATDNPNGKVRMPFIVNTNGMEVKVLGTHFDINAYNDENNIKTTLLEGMVTVSNLPTGISKAENARHTLTLLPGHQSILNSDSRDITVKEVDTEEVIAWKNGMFVFNDTRLETVMNSISRWYNVGIKYEGDVKELKFGGVVSRKSNVSSLLDLLSLTGVVHFDIQNRTIIVKSEIQK